MRRRQTAASLAGALVLLLGGCDALATDKTPERVRDGTAGLDLTVTGRPTPGTLAVTEHVLARLKARDADGLADRAGRDGGTRSDAERWVARWGAAAQRPAVADFGQGEKTASVEVRFAGEPSALILLLTPGDRSDPYGDRFGVALRDDR
ncbi:hypothetical protein [Streptomyces lavendofoliae]|uniref:hypothetical protein n=1 Tax=Streptomyces lavendofoliae TaxID=67314 RepID=UPI00300F7B6B